MPHSCDRTASCGLVYRAPRVGESRSLLRTVVAQRDQQELLLGATPRPTAPGRSRSPGNWRRPVTPLLQAWPLHPGDDFVLRMRDTLERLALPSRWCRRRTWLSRYRRDRSCVPPPQTRPADDGAAGAGGSSAPAATCWRSLVYIDLTGANRQIAKAQLLEGVRRGPVPPIEDQSFPAPWHLAGPPEQNRDSRDRRLDQQSSSSQPQFHRP